jgi:hypothetical protein
VLTGCNRSSTGLQAGEHADQPPPAEQFGFSSEDDGSRDDALLGHNMRITPYRPDGEALARRACRSGGFVANEWSPDNDRAAFAAKFREVLDS